MTCLRPPNLINIRVNGKPVKAVAQVSKQAFVYVFDRVTGRPIWPIEERPVPQSTVPGEKSSRTQPFPTKPAPFDRQGVTENDVVDFTPELRKEALAVLARYNYGPLYTPPSLEKPMIQMPGWAGGASWAGAACDVEDDGDLVRCRCRGCGASGATRLLSISFSRRRRCWISNQEGLTRAHQHRSKAPQ